MAGPTVITDGTGPATPAEIAAVNAQNGAVTPGEVSRLNNPGGPSPVASSAVDVVAVLKTSDGTQAFPKARPMTVSVNEGGELMQHPLETGAQIVDHLVKRLNEITYPVIIKAPYKPVLDEIRQLYEAGTKFIVQTKTGNYSDMVLFDLPHDETPDGYDMITVTLKFREAKFIKPTLGGPVPRRKKHANTTKRGQVQAAAPAPAPRGSFLFRHIPVGH